MNETSLKLPGQADISKYLFIIVYRNALWWAVLKN